MSVFDQVQGIAADILVVDQERVTAQSSPENLDGWDSVQHLNLILALEDKFGMQFEPEEIDRMRTIGGITRIIERRLNGAS